MASLIAMCRETFIQFGVLVEISSDSGPEYASGEFRDFLDRWGVRHRMSATYFAQSNDRAKVLVKAVKRAMKDNVGEDGWLDNDKFVRTLLQLRNTPDRDTSKSPAELLLGWPLKDALPSPYGRKDQLCTKKGALGERWHIWDKQETALHHRLVQQVEKLDDGAHDLLPCLGSRTRRVPTRRGGTRLGL